MIVSVLAHAIQSAAVGTELTYADSVVGIRIRDLDQRNAKTRTTTTKVMFSPQMTRESRRR